MEIYLESSQINPFDPGVHQGLALAYQKLGEKEKAKKAEETLHLLVRGLQAPRPDPGGSNPKPAE